MRFLLTSLCVVALAATANAQGVLVPAGGTYYPDDAMNQGKITAVFEEAVEAPITYGDNSYAVPVDEEGYTSATWRVGVIAGDTGGGNAFLADRYIINRNSNKVKPILICADYF